MLLALSIAFTSVQGPGDLKRAAAAYRFPANQGEQRWLSRLVDDELFDTWVVDPSPNSLTTATAKGKVKFVTPSKIDTSANRKWRDATIEYVNSKISPKEWIRRTASLGETFHFVTSPKTPDLRSITSNLPPTITTYSARGVFAETLLIYWPGTPCFYATDVWRTSYFPDDKRHESWILAMNDYLGPMLSLRAEHPELRHSKQSVLRADSVPGLLVFSQVIGGRTYTFYFNNSNQPIELPSGFLPDASIMARGLDLDAKKPKLGGAGSVLTIVPPE